MTEPAKFPNTGVSAFAAAEYQRRGANFEDESEASQFEDARSPIEDVKNNSRECCLAIKLPLKLPFSTWNALRLSPTVKGG